ncbi:MAG TPA: phosphoribosylglycinamide formyltransferase [Methylomirabilota bacterium]|jgi:phosphoribosylglycinamide formyltransferase-1|nr:phosphoribosylglycinamide formyltransferase [Methylomirabilota bacterium]
MRSPPLVLGVLASGRGSNLQAILDAIAAGRCPARVAVVVSDRKDAAALSRARQAGIRALHVDSHAYPDRAAFDEAVAAVLDEHGVELVCLAGYMRVLSAEFVRRYRGRVLNVHPALLPAFPGLRAQRQALDHGVKVAGATVHLVDEGVDTGPIVLQAAVPVLDGETEESLAARILVEEHRLYPEAIRLYAEGRLHVKGRRVSVRTEP